MTDLLDSALETIRRPQPGELWSVGMIARYGHLVLALEDAFNDALGSAPADPTADDDEFVEEVFRDFWPTYAGDAIDAIEKISEAMGMSGVRPKIIRIKRLYHRCRDLLPEMGANADPLAGVGAIEEPKDKCFIRLATQIRALRQHVADEMAELKFLQIEGEHVALYESDAPLFGELVAERFSSANDDIEEAGKCLALGRGTATVFHLMRIMEAGLKALGAELGIPYAPSWESYIRQLETLLDGGNYSKLTDEQKAKRPFYQAALGDLTAVKSAWRNPTMHIVRKYDARQAKRVFEAVHGLMEEFAKNLSADPLAVISTGQTGAQP